MLVLLVIFMVTAPMMQQGLTVNLPQSRQSQSVNAQPIYVTIPADFHQRRFVQIGEESVRLEVLAERVRQVLLPWDDKSLFVRADGTVEAVPGGYREAVARIADLWAERTRANAGEPSYTLTVSAPTSMLPTNRSWPGTSTKSSSEPSANAKWA